MLRAVFGQRLGYKIYKWNGWKVNLSINMVAVGVAVGIILGLLLDIHRAEGVQDVHIVNVAEASSTPQEVRLVVVVDWTRERIIEEIYKVFPENGNLAVRVADCESGLQADIQSNHVLNYGREESFGIFQIHAKDHQETAERLGLYNYKTDPGENIALARHIYDDAKARKGDGWIPWTCYTKKMI